MSDYEAWLREKEMEEGTHPNAELYHAIKRTVDAKYEGIDPIAFVNRALENDPNWSDED